MKDTFREIITKMGRRGDVGRRRPENDYGLQAPGRIFMKWGTTRMGSDKNKSVLE